MAIPLFKEKYTRQELWRPLTDAEFRELVKWKYMVEKLSKWAPWSYRFTYWFLPVEIIGICLCFEKLKAPEILAEIKEMENEERTTNNR